MKPEIATHEALMYKSKIAWPTVLNRWVCRQPFLMRPVSSLTSPNNHHYAIYRQKKTSKTYCIYLYHIVNYVHRRQPPAHAEPSDSLLGSAHQQPRL